MGACEECINNNCYSNGCNCNCIQRGSTCYTEWLGAGENPFPEGLNSEGRKLLDHSAFIQAFPVLHPTELMQKAGIKIGSLVTHVNGFYPNDGKDFGKLINSLPSGSVLTVFDFSLMAFQDVQI